MSACHCYARHTSIVSSASMPDCPPPPIGRELHACQLHWWPCTMFAHGNTSNICLSHARIVKAGHVRHSSHICIMASLLQNGKLLLSNGLSTAFLHCSPTGARLRQLAGPAQEPAIQLDWPLFKGRSPVAPARHGSGPSCQIHLVYDVEAADQSHERAAVTCLRCF